MMLTLHHGWGSERIKVAIYKEDEDGMSTYGEKGMFDALKETDDMEPSFLSEMSAASLEGFDVLIITKKKWTDHRYHPETWKEEVREWAANGGGVMAMHETAGCANANSGRHYQWNLFPEIGKGLRLVRERENVIEVGHSITTNAAPNVSIPNQIFRQTYPDHMVFAPEKGASRIVYGIKVDQPNQQLVMDYPVILAGSLDQGRVILNGLLLGFDEETGMEVTPQGPERHLLLDGIRWLAKRLPDKEASTTHAYIGAIVGPAEGVWRQGPDGLILGEKLADSISEELDHDSLKEILGKVNPPALAKDLRSVAIGILKHPASEQWRQALIREGCENVKEVVEADFEEGLPGISILMIGETPVAGKHLPILKEFMAKGGKLLATQGAGFDPRTRKYQLTPLLLAGKHINTIGVEYLQMFMPEEYRREEIDPRRSEWIVNRLKTAYKNGADGMFYFTNSQLFKPESARLDEAQPNGAIQNWNNLEGYEKEVTETITQAPLWKKGHGLMLNALPDFPQIGILVLRHTQVRDMNPREIAEACYRSGINILTVQMAFLDRVFDPEEKKGDVQKLREAFFESIGPELEKKGIAFWVNIFPSRSISHQYSERHPEETKIDSQGKHLAELCPVKNGKGFQSTLAFLERIFTKNRNLSGISLDEPMLKTNECFCDSCKALFTQRFPKGEMNIHSEDFRKFRESIWSEYYLEPFAELLRRHRPANGVLALAAPGIQKNWSMNAEGISNSGVQLFANENAQTRADLKFHDYWASYSLSLFPFSGLTLLKDHPVLQGIETMPIQGDAVKVDTFKGAQTLAYVTDGSQSFPGIVATHDTGAIYFSFDPFSTPKLITNTVYWLMKNDRHHVPAGMVAIPAGSFKSKRPHDDALSPRFPEDMRLTEEFVEEFYLDTTEVTNQEYEKYDPNHRRSALSKADDMPVVNVSMNDAKRYCNWRSQKEGLSPVYIETKNGFKTDLSQNGYRLPTVTEWQKAATGFELNRYSWGSTFWRASGRVGVPFQEGAVPVASYRANDYGLYDMTGNVWEWCEGYENFPKRQGRICGGSWNNEAFECDIWFYNFLYENHTRSTIGFRCARNKAN